VPDKAVAELVGNLCLHRSISSERNSTIRPVVTSIR
jgi:hypothetical protein